MKTVPLRQTMTLVLIFVVVTASMIVLDRRNALTPLRDGLSEVTDPISSAFMSASDGFGGQSNLQQQLATVTAQRDQLNAENSKLKNVEQENAQLRQQAKIQQANPNWDIESATVIGTDPTGTQKFVKINKGSADGIQKGMAVVSPYYYVGQVSEVEQHSATVMLIIDISMKVGARLEDSGADGTVVGEWQTGKQAMVMDHIDKAVAPKSGEKIVTSDLTRNIPAGIIIGVVDGTPVRDAQTDQLQVDVAPAADFNNLDMVMVIKSYDPN
jgi:rod shape-determining protein MreC